MIKMGAKSIFFNSIKFFIYKLEAPAYHLISRPTWTTLWMPFYMKHQSFCHLEQVYV